MLKKPITPKSRIKAALHKLWLWSRERNAAIKFYKNTCQNCVRKASTAKGKKFKVQVHHREGICNWEKIISMIYDQILVSPDKLEVLCKECHLKKHKAAGVDR